MSAAVPSIRLRHTQHYQQRYSALPPRSIRICQRVAMSTAYRRSICLIPEAVKGVMRRGRSKALDGLANGDTGLPRIMKIHAKSQAPLWSCNMLQSGRRKCRCRDLQILEWKRRRLEEWLVSLDLPRQSMRITGSGTKGIPIG